MQSKGEIVIYKAKDGSQQLEVRLEEETVWLSQAQMVELFDSSRQNISHHIRQIYKEGELKKRATVKKYLTVQQEANRMVSRNVEVYNLDVVISVGYRVKSKRGTQFRIWATQKIKDHLVKGYTFNEQRLRQVTQNMQQLQHAVKIIQQTGQYDQLNVTEAKGLLEIISGYTQSFILLNQFDTNTLPDARLNENITYEIDYEEAVKAIAELKKQLMKKKEASVLFGNERDGAFAGILNSVVQTFGGKYLYKSIEEQAAHLLYFVIKNHPFTDGNKRIGAFLFVWFLEKNKHRFKKSGELKINDNALVALALLLAQSNPDDKDLMTALVINLING